MTQGWFSVAGLIFDLAGVLLIVSEWKLALLSAEMEARSAELGWFLSVVGHGPANRFTDEDREGHE